MARTTILIAEYSYLIRKGLSSILQELDHVDIVQSMDNNKNICTMVNQTQPDILIINPDMLPAGYKDPKEPFANKNRLSLVLISVESRVKERFKADGYINYRDDQNVIMDQIQEIISKKTHKSSAPHKTNETLSAREKNILKHIALGQTSKEIADQLFISVHTVITHRKNITQKLGIKSVSGLTVYAILHNLIAIDDVK